MRRPPRLKVPERAHPLVRRLFAVMEEEQCGVMVMAERAGINKNTLMDWRRKQSPRIGDLEACFNVLGYTLEPRRRDDC